MIGGSTKVIIYMDNMDNHEVRFRSGVEFLIMIKVWGIEETNTNLDETTNS